MQSAGRDAWGIIKQNSRLGVRFGKEKKRKRQSSRVSSKEACNGLTSRWGRLTPAARSPCPWTSLRHLHRQEQITASPLSSRFYRGELLNCMFHNTGDYPVYKCCLCFVILKHALVVSARIWELRSVFPWRPHQDRVLGTQIRHLVWAESDSNLQSHARTVPLRV